MVSRLQGPSRRFALLSFSVAATAAAAGIVYAFARFPGGYDWAYTVISKLASVRQNPDGARWLAGSLLVAVAFLWPVARYFGRTYGREGALPRAAVVTLKVGLVGAALLGLEGTFVLEYSRRVDNAHEAVALVTFLGFYGGVLGLFAHRIRSGVRHALPALSVVLPLVAVGVSQLILYLDQRDLGWVGPDWRAMGVPVWLSFAFWQWLAVLFLGVGLGYLVASGPPRGGRSGPGLPSDPSGENVEVVHPAPGGSSPRPDPQAEASPPGPEP